jgi:thiamine pyrophosphokinase
VTAAGTVLVVAAGDEPASDLLAGLPAGAWVIAADGGVAHAFALGLPVHEAVGDFDSASGADLARVRAAGGRTERHPVAKDATDLELALTLALDRDPRRIVVIGGHGGRFDHWLANALLLAAPRFAGVRLEARMGAATVTVVRGAVTLTGVPGDLVSLLPAHGPARGVRTLGLRYPLLDEDLPAGTSRGVSNVFVEPSATVSVTDGVLLAVQPGVAEDADRH